MKKIVVLICSMIICIAFTGCSNSNNNTAKENIENVLTNRFTSNDEFIEQWEESLNVIGEDIENVSSENNNENEVDSYLEDMYKKYFIESAYDKFISTDALMYQVAAKGAGYTMSVDKIMLSDIEGENASYSFSVDVLCTKEQEEFNSTVIGTVNVDEDGKITRIVYSDDGGLYNSLLTD